MEVKKLNQLKVVMAEKDLPNIWLSEKLGVSQATVSKWMTNFSQPNLETLIKISKVLNVEVAELIRYDIDQYLKSVDSEMDSTTQKNGITTQKAQGTTQKTLNTTQKKILNYLKEHPHATRKDMAVVIGDITEDGIKFNIGKLQQYGLLKREGGRKSGTWVVIDK